MDFLGKEQCDGIFIYSKENCKYCVELKNMLDSLFIKYECADCVFSEENEKKEFLEYIKNKNGGKPWTTFPMVFYDGVFIGGYNEIGIHLEKINAFDGLLF